MQPFWRQYVTSTSVKVYSFAHIHFPLCFLVGWDVISQVPALGSAMMLLPPIDSANGLVSLNKTFLLLVLSGHGISSQQQYATITVAVSDNPCLGNYRILTKWNSRLLYEVSPWHWADLMLTAKLGPIWTDKGGISLFLLSQEYELINMISVTFHFVLKTPNNWKRGQWLRESG